MDDNAQGPAVTEQLANVQERIDVHREHMSDTIEALAYKTDVVARGSEALSDGIETAKSAAITATEEAALRAVDLTARTSEVLSDALTTAELSAADALDFATATVQSVEPQTRRRAGLYLGIVAAVLVVIFAWRKRTAGGE